MSAVAIEAEARNHPRTNTMLAATIEYAGERLDVFVRNLSVAGALIEGRGLLPERGEAVMLHRMDISVPGTVMWRTPGRCGLAFNRTVKVEDMIRRGKGTAATVPIHQNRVDAIQSALRRNVPLPSFSNTEELVGAAAIGKRLSDELGYAHRLCQTVNEALSSDAYILARYGVALQQLDESEQLLRKLESEHKRAGG